MNLVYCSLGLNMGYVDLLRLSVESLYGAGKFDGEYVVLCPDHGHEEYHKRLNAIPHVQVVKHRWQPGMKLVDAITRVMSESYNLAAHIDVTRYDKCLLMDCDTIVNGPICKVFDLVGDAICGCAEGLMGDRFHGRSLFSMGMLKVPGLNPGTVGYKPTKENVELLRIARETALKNPDPEIFEQNGFNWVMWNSGKYDYNLTPEVDLCTPGNEPRTDKTISHFLCGIGEPGMKLERMERHVTRRL